MAEKPSLVIGASNWLKDAVLSKILKDCPLVFRNKTINPPKMSYSITHFGT